MKVAGGSLWKAIEEVKVNFVFDRIALVVKGVLGEENHILESDSYLTASSFTVLEW